jgi:hypothetical protein
LQKPHHYVLRAEAFRKNRAAGPDAGRSISRLIAGTRAGPAWRGWGGSSLKLALNLEFTLYLDFTLCFGFIYFDR